MTTLTAEIPPQNAADASPERSFGEVWLVTAGHMMTHWYPATFYLLLPLIGADLGLSFGQIGSILSCQFIAGALSNVPGGIMVDAIGRKRLLLAAALFWIGIPYLIMGFAHAYWMLLCCAALVGIANNVWHPTAIPMLARDFPRQKGLVVSLHAMGGNLGDAIAPPIVGAMLTVLSWRDVVVLNVIPGAVAAVLLLLALARPKYAGEAQAARPRKSGDILASLRMLLANRTVLMLSLSGAVRAMTATTLLTFLPIFLSGDLGYSPAATGACLFALQAAGFMAAPVTGHLSDRIGRRRIIMSSMGMSAVVLLFMAFAGRSPAFVLFVAFLGFFLFAIRAVLQAWLLDATPQHAGGTSIGILFGTQAAGAAIGPIAGGIIADHYGIMATFYFLAASIVVANMFIFLTPATVGGSEQRQPATV
jgi:MFS transporter, FSR family, fosmidomycin resistance protein